MGWLVAIEHGSVRLYEKDGKLGLDDIYAVTESPFDVAMTIRSSRSRGITWLVNDEGLFKFEAARTSGELSAYLMAEGKPHNWAISFVRPWDGQPIVGPILVCAVQGEHHVPLTREEADSIYNGLAALGYTPT